MLSVRGLEAGYGRVPVLFSLDLDVAQGEVLALMGRNGMGKTTTVRAIMGLLRPTAGEIRVHGCALQGAAPHKLARAGLGLVPEGRQIFPTLGVEENLVATARPAKTPRPGMAPWTLHRIYALFPRLAERRRLRGAQLSGGEQQMLSIGRALMTNPALLILDEATEGLAPLVQAEIFACLAHLRDEGLAILLIDKALAATTRLASRVLVLEKGRAAWSGPAATLAADPALADRYLHV